VTERQRDRESRPNPLKDQEDSPKALSPGAAGRFLGKVHSVAKQDFFVIAYWIDFRGFGIGFGSQDGN